MSGRDDQTLETLLRAPDHRILVNEQILFGAFDNARLTIERPLTLERDGDCYVDVEGFLEWFSLYIVKTKAETLFPSELASVVRRANSKAAAPKSPIANQEFESLTLAFEDWFDKNLEDLPETIRQRVERDFSLIPWGDLSAAQRRHLALQMDYQHDPATEQERQFWWDFFARRDELQAEIAKWKSAATPTASDISLQESRLKKLQQEFDRMELQQRHARGDYYPERKGLDADKVSTPITTDYIAFPKAMNLLREKWQATPEELAAWIFLGSEEGGIAAYHNANEVSPPPRFFFGYFHDREDYLAPLMASWFRQDDIDRFEPTERYLTGTALIERWSKQPGLHPEAFIRAKITESRLLDMHPTFGGTEATFGENHGHFPPLSAGLFAMSYVERIEAEDGLDSAPVLPNSDAEPVQDGADKKGGRPKGPLAEAVTMAYLHFHAVGNVEILKPGNTRSFLKSFNKLVKNETPLVEFGNRNIADDIGERIKDVKVPREGKCFVTTHDRLEGRKINPGIRYSQEAIAKLLTALRKKYPILS